MAQPIFFHPNAAPVSAVAEERLRNAPEEHAEALLSAYAILQGLHDQRILDILRGALGSRDKLLQIAVDSANAPASVSSIRNLIILGKLVGTFDPQVLNGMAHAIPEGMAAGTGKPLGIWDMLKKLFSEDTRRAVSVLVCLLESMGKALKSADAR